MSNPAVGWVLDQLQSVVDAQPAGHSLERIDRDDSELLDGDIRTRTRELRSGNYVGAATADRSETPIGTEYDLQVEEVVGIRIEGLHYSAKGHVDPDGQNGVVFDGDPGLVQDIKTALYQGRRSPDAGRTSVNFTDLTITNQAPQSSRFADYYRFDADILFSGFEEL